MKKILLSFLLSLAAPALFAQWVEQPSNASANHFVQFIDAVNPNVCWGLVADPANQLTPLQEFVRTTDGGATWTDGLINNAAGLSPSSICAINGDTAWVAMFNPGGGAGAILRTNDGGLTWATQPSAAFNASGNFPDFIYFWDANNGVCLGDPTGGYYEIYTTTDGGTTWIRVPTANIPLPLGGEFGITDVFTAIGNGTVWFGTNLGRIYKSVDMGLNWTAASTPFTGSYIGSIAFRDANNGIATSGSTGGVADIIRTTDGGTTWTAAGSNTGGFSTVLSSCYVPGTDSTYFLSNSAASSVNGTAYSPNDGTSWVIVDNLIHTDIDFVNDSIGWTGSNQLNAPMYKWSTPIVTPINEVASSSIDVSSNTGLVTQTPKATVINNGLTTQTFDVTMTITGGYTSTKTVTGLSFLNSTQVLFDPWTPAATGPYTITLYTSLVGDSNNSNDTLVKNVTVYEAFENYGWVSKQDLTSGTFGLAGAFELNGLYSNSPGTLYSIGGAVAGAVAPDMNAFDDVTGFWTSAPAMPTAKYQFSAHTVNRKIYCIGGYSSGFVPDENNYVYDIDAGTWSTMTPMPTAVGDYASGVYRDSLIYFIGGYDGGGDQNGVQVYNTYTDVWSLATSKTNTATSGLRGAINGNQIVIAGGYSQLNGGPVDEAMIGTIDPSNPLNITWQSLPAYPGGTASRLGAGTVFRDLKPLIVFTGGDPTGQGLEVLGDCWAYDLTLNQWLVGAEKTTHVSNISDLVGVVYNDSLYMAVAGGYDGVNFATANEWLNLGYTLIDGVKNTPASGTAMSLYPNPASSFITVRLNDTRVRTMVKVTDLTGRIVDEDVFAEGQNTLRLSTKQLAPGIYSVQLISADQSVLGSSKFVKQ